MPAVLFVAACAAPRDATEDSWVRRASDFLDPVIPDSVTLGPKLPALETKVRLDPTEVDEAFEVPLGHFLDPTNHVARVREYAGEPIEFIDMPFGPRNIWGATAGMLLTLYRLLRGEELAA